ncbi:GDSL-type esterase/lipase family protein [Tamlana sp. 2_MG-2023]|uniref:GDSL-type esterase/lipase family protein n=1 Tax=unclassified Tamlana TaxID=2614803 RepID=UPI0026E1FA57|nr:MULTISPECIES: GDSL-type esterase/lipase family protein [unclassified Tamlana]MDO6761496.1 GDSL-type esterase/lipase family protein [Tamlana sp. 2_MG-2023]MDO6792329.1 GDSL-type esterase/lipase family protein [Tamlana sp. 1_MG-2023]
MKYLILLLFFTTSIHAQHYVLDSIKPTLGHLINFEANTLKYADKSPAFKTFFAKLDRIYSGEKDKLQIMHIGGSHIQADFYSNKLRTYLQNMNPYATGQRGFVFPYHLAHTNNPLNYRVSSSTQDKWQGYRCSITKDSIAWGLSGITAAFRDISDTLSIKANYKNYNREPYNFDKLRVFYNTWRNDYNLVVLDSTLVKSDTINYVKMYREFRFNRTIDSLEISLKLKDSATVNPEFDIMGLEFINNNPGIEYTTIGVNGASFKRFDRSTYFERQFDLYNPDLFIISIGTNDAYMPEDQFDAEGFRYYYKSFLNMIQRKNPNCAILLTVPNDSYYRRRKPNPNTVTQQRIILEIAEEYNMAVWDFFEIMGGLGSSQKWYKNELMPKDRVHFTLFGYSVKADLMLDAIVNAWAASTGRNATELLNYFKRLDE